MCAEHTGDGSGGPGTREIRTRALGAGLWARSVSAWALCVSRGGRRALRRARALLRRAGEGPESPLRRCRAAQRMPSATSLRTTTTRARSGPSMASPSTRPCAVPEEREREGGESRQSVQRPPQLEVHKGALGLPCVRVRGVCCRPAPSIRLCAHRTCAPLLRSGCARGRLGPQRRPLRAGRPGLERGAHPGARRRLREEGAQRLGAEGAPAPRGGHRRRRPCPVLRHGSSRCGGGAALRRRLAPREGRAEAEGGRQGPRAPSRFPDRAPWCGCQNLRSASQGVLPWESRSRPGRDVVLVPTTDPRQPEQGGGPRGVCAKAYQSKVCFTRERERERVRELEGLPTHARTRVNTQTHTHTCSHLSLSLSQPERGLFVAQSICQVTNSRLDQRGVMATTRCGGKRFKLLGASMCVAHIRRLRTLDSISALSASSFSSRVASVCVIRLWLFRRYVLQDLKPLENTSSVQR